MNFPIRKYRFLFCMLCFIISRTGIFKLDHLMSTIHTTDQLGTALRIARKQLGLTQPQLALAAGVGTRFIVDLESGKPTVRLEHVLRVIDALGGELQLGGLPEAAHEDGAGQAAAATEGADHDA